MRIVKKTFLASILIFVIFVIWFFIPMAVSINSVGKEYFLVDNNEIRGVYMTNSRIIPVS